MTFNYLTGSNGREGQVAPSTDRRGRRVNGQKGSTDRPDDPGGQVRVAQPGLAGSGEHLDVAGLGVADVHHERSRWCLHVTPGGCRGRGAGRGRRAQGPAERRDGEPRGARRRGALEQRTPGHTLSRLLLCIVTGHDDPFGDWSACTSPRAKATPGGGGGEGGRAARWRPRREPVPTSARASGGLR